ncbi:ATP-binding protein [Thermodesulfobacteriota bacterium]
MNLELEISKDPRIQQILEFIYSFSSGNLDARCHLVKADDDLDAVIGGLNMLAEELQASSVETKLANEALKKEETKFRILVEESPLGIALVSADGRYKYLNPKFIEIFGYDLTDIPNSREWFKKAYPDLKYREKIISELIDFNSQPAGGISFNRVFTTRSKDGAEKEILFRVIRLETNDWLIFYEDISNKKVMEEQLTQAGKMEAIGTLAGGIAHDFNNILSGIIGYTELSLMDTEIGPSTQQNLRNVINAGERAKSLVKQILTFSRHSQRELKPLKMKLVIKEALNLVRSTLPTNIMIEQDINSESLIMGDSSEIHQIIMNLCTNAKHAISEIGGTIYVSLNNIEEDEISTTLSNELSCSEYLELKIRDTGKGIDPSYIGRIFDPFFTTKETGKGTGMGLSVVHGIIKRYKGTITVQSIPGKGACFLIFLPVIESDHDEKSAPKEPLKTGSERVLFVDDEGFQVDFGKQLLERIGYKVVTRTSSLEALALFKKHPYEFDLIITDMNMPNLTGVGLSEEVIKIRPDIPIILCTGFSDMITKEQAFQLGIKAFLMKPAAISEFADTIRKVLDGE